MIIQKLKTHPPYWQHIYDGDKTFEVRYAGDREFNVGDTLILAEYIPGTGYTGRECLRKITYVLTDPVYVKEDHAILGLKIDR